MRTEFVGSRANNDKLLDEYYARLLELGFARQLGLYVTSSQLKQVTWNKHKDHWWLWKIDHFKSQSELVADISTSTFETPGGEL